MIWKRYGSGHSIIGNVIEKILPPEFFRLTFPSMKRDWLHGFKDRLIAQKGPPRRTLLIPKMGSKMFKASDLGNFREHLRVPKTNAATPKVDDLTWEPMG